MSAAILTYLAPQAFDRACNQLQKAQASYTDTANALAELKCSVEFKRAELLSEGIEGKNADEREATLRLKLFDEHTELLGLEVTLNDSRRDLEQARITWDCLRYKLRLMEVQKVLERAA